MSSHSHSHDLKQLLSLLHQSCQTYDLPALHSCIRSLRGQHFPATEWTRHLVHIFVMLTSQEVQVPSFLRRGHIFAIFRYAIEERKMEVEGAEMPSRFRKLVGLLLRMVHDVFQDTASRRQIQLQVYRSLNGAMNKLLSSLMGYATLDNPEAKLPKDKAQVLLSVFPIPTEAAPYEFIYPDLLLWYEFFLVMRNHFYCLHPEPTHQACFLTTIRREADQVREPILRWVCYYNFLERASVEYRRDSQEMGEFCLQELIHATKSSRQIYEKYMESGQSAQGGVMEELCQNIFNCMVRFDCMHLSFCLVQEINISSNSRLLQVLSDQISKFMGIILAKCTCEMDNIGKNQQNQGKYYEKLNTFRLGLIYFMKQLRKSFDSQAHSHDPQQIKKTSVLLFRPGLRDLSPKMQMLVDKHKRMSQLADVFNQATSPSNEVTLAEIRKSFCLARVASISEQLVASSCFSFKQAILGRMAPIEALRFCLCLLTEFYLDHADLLITCSDLACRALMEAVEEDRDVVPALEICSQLWVFFGEDSWGFVCSLCGRIENKRMCGQCFRECRSFCFPESFCQVKKHLCQKLHDHLSLVSEINQYSLL